LVVIDIFGRSKRGSRRPGSDKMPATTEAAQSLRPKLLTTRSETRGPISVVSVTGEIDDNTADLFVTRVEEQMRRCRTVIVDLTRVTYLGVAGLDALHRVNISQYQTGARWIAVPSPAVNRSLRLAVTGIHIPTAKTVAAAMNCVHEAACGENKPSK
jgi:anti-anti-sigma factor